MKYMIREKSAAVKDIDFDIADILVRNIDILVALISTHL